MNREMWRAGAAWVGMVGFVLWSGWHSQLRADEAKPEQRQEVRLEFVDVKEAEGGDSKARIAVVKEVGAEGQAGTAAASEGAPVFAFTEKVNTDGKVENRLIRVDGGRLTLTDNPTFLVRSIADGEQFAAGKYWIGVACSEVPPAVRAQVKLPEKVGLLVENVLPDSPAAKAGFKLFDVLIAVEDGAPFTEVKQLLAKVEEAKPLKLKILRGGKEEAIEVTPAERPKSEGDFLKFVDVQAQGGAAGGLAAFVGGAGQASGNLNLIEKAAKDFVLVRPSAGLMLPPNVGKPGSGLPENLRITITREGKQPAKILVERKQQEAEKWEITEDKLQELPNDLRPVVEQMLKGSPVQIPLPPGFNPGAGFGGIGTGGLPEQAVIRMGGAPPRLRLEARGMVQQKGGEGDLRRSVDEVNKKLGELQRQIKELEKAGGEK